VQVVSPEEDVADQLVMWDAWHTRHTADDRATLHEECREALLHALPPPDRSGPVLELGCGQGFDAIPIGQAGYNVFALDFSATALSIARRRLATCCDLRVNYLLRDISRPLPYPDRAFFGIFSYLALHYFDQAKTVQVFNEITRVAAPSCVFSFAVRSVADPLFGKGRRLDRGLYDYNGHIRHFFDQDELASLLSTSWTVTELRATRAHYLSDDFPAGGIIKVLATRNYDGPTRTS
jgi:SAM-dependent methyltransferase